MLSLQNIILLEQMVNDPNVSQEDRAMAQAVIDAYDEMDEEEILQEAMEDKRKPTPEQRARFERRLEDEIKRRYGEPWCAKLL